MYNKALQTGSLWICLFIFCFTQAQVVSDSISQEKIESYYEARPNHPNRLEDYGWALNVGYSYMNTHTGYVGINYVNFNFLPVTVGVGGYYGSFNGDFKFIPAIDLSSATFYGVYTTVSTKHINPGIQLNGFNYFWIRVGYSWSFDDSVNIKGPTFGLHFFLNLKGDFNRPIL